MKRAFLLLVAVLLAGCVESDPSTIEAGPPDGTTTVPAPPPGGPGGPGPPDDPTPPGTVIVGGTEVVPETTVPRPASPRPSATGGPGSAAAWLLRTTGARQIVVQVLTHAGAEPRRATLDRLEEVLGDASGKPVSVVGGRSPAPRQVWSGGDLRAAADEAAVTAEDGTAVVRFLFVGGRSAEGDGVLGVAASGDVAAVFSDRVDGAATGLASPAAIERAVAVHELGHLLGLVDLVLDTGRVDPEHPGHSSNRRSVMYWAVESSLVGDLLAGGPPQRFDEQDLADLAAIRGG